MDVITLGTGTLVPQAHRASACVAVVDAGRVLVLDLGRNALSRLVECGIDPLDLDEVCFTHLHPDHSCELVSLLFGLNYGAPSARSRPLRLRGPAGLRELVERLQAAWKWLTPRYPLDLQEIGSGRVEGLGFEVEAVRLDHGETENLGYRVRSRRGGRTVAYTGDTGPCPALVDLARGVDLLVSECAGTDAAPLPFHLSPTPLAEAARDAGVGHLVLTHLYPDVDPAEVLRGVSRIFAGRVTLARDRLRLQV